MTGFWCDDGGALLRSCREEEFCGDTDGVSRLWARGGRMSGTGCIGSKRLFLEVLQVVYEFCKVCCGEGARFGRDGVDVDALLSERTLDGFDVRLERLQEERVAAQFWVRMTGEVER